MTLRNFPPADQCDPEDLDNLADLVVRDPRASYDLAGSRAHIEALCRRYQRLAQHLVEATEERDDLRVRCADFMAARARLNDLAEDLFDDLASVRTEVAALAATLDAERNERQAEVLQAGADRERADEAEAATEVFEATARAALAILARRTVDNPVPLAELVRAVDGRIARALVREKQISAAFSDKFEQAMQQLEDLQETHAANDRIGRQLGATCEAITGKTIEQVNLKLDEELTANPDVSSLHHARDMREPEDCANVTGRPAGFHGVDGPLRCLPDYHQPDCPHHRPEETTP